MSITVQHVNPAGSRVYMGTLTQGEDLHAAFAVLAQGLRIGAASVNLLGGLTAVDLTAYDFATQTRLPPLTVSGALEIVAGHGIISTLDGAPHVHLHLTLAQRNPTQPQAVTLVAGHAARATAFAVEFALTAYDGVIVRRAHDAETGLNLWVLPPFTDF